MIPRLKPDLKLCELLASINFLKKNAVFNFEDAFKKEMGSSFIQSFAHGRSAIFSILKGLNLEGKEVICPSYTCVVVPNAIVTAGCIPVFVDSKFDDFNMDLDLVEQAITSNTAVIIATSIFGHPVDLDKLAVIKKNYPHIIIIQDCAHSFTVEYRGKSVHQFGDFAIFALNISKIITSIFGGVLITNNQYFYKKIHNYYNSVSIKPNTIKQIKLIAYLFSVFFAFMPSIYRVINILERKGFLNRYVKYYDSNLIDMPKDFLDGFSPVQARVGLVQLKKLKNIIKHRKGIANIYYENLKEIDQIRLPLHLEGSSFSHYVILTNSAKSLLEFMYDNGVQLGELIDYHIPEMSVYQSYRFISNNIALNFPNQVLNLPVHMGIKEKDAKRISHLIKFFFNSRFAQN
jgi:dTDP-4-amino-4,6-dideoxygalactose transaminase